MASAVGKNIILANENPAREESDDSVQSCIEIRESTKFGRDWVIETLNEEEHLLKHFLVFELSWLQNLRLPTNLKKFQETECQSI
jgi:hypothetical protein